MSKHDIKSCTVLIFNTGTYKAVNNVVTQIRKKMRVDSGSPVRIQEAYNDT